MRTTMATAGRVVQGAREMTAVRVRTHMVIMSHEHEARLEPAPVPVPGSDEVPPHDFLEPDWAGHARRRTHIRRFREPSKGRSGYGQYDEAAAGLYRASGWAARVAAALSRRAFGELQNHPRRSPLGVASEFSGIVKSSRHQNDGAGRPDFALILC